MATSHALHQLVVKPWEVVLSPEQDVVAGQVEVDLGPAWAVVRTVGVVVFASGEDDVRTPSGPECVAHFEVTVRPFVRQIGDNDV